MGVATARILQDNIDFANFYNGFTPTKEQESILRDAGINELGYDFYALQRSVVDFPFHAQYFFKDPGNPQLPLILEPWQSDEMYYAQFGEAYLDWKDNLYTEPTVIVPFFQSNGKVVRKKIAINSPRGFGKSIFAAIIAVEFAIHFSHLKIALFSTSQEQANSLMAKVRYFLEHSIFAMMISKKQNSKTHIQLTNGSEIKAFPQSEVSTRGEHPHIKVIDEKARIQPEFLQAAIRPMGRKECWLEIGISTPYGMANDHYKDCMNHEYFHVHLLKPTEVRWVDDDKLKENMAIVSNRIGRAEYYAEFLSDSGTVFPPSHIQRMFTLKPRKAANGKVIEWRKLKIQSKGDPNKWYVMGCDYGKHKDYSTISIGHQLSNGMVITDRIERYRKVSYDFVIKRSVDLCNDFNVKLIVPDGSGVGIALVEMLEKRLRKKGLRVMIFKSKVQNAKTQRKKRLTETGKSDEDIRLGFIFNNHSKMSIVEWMQLQLMADKFKVPYHNDIKNIVSNYEEHELYPMQILEDEMTDFTFSKTHAGNVVYGHPDTEDAHDDVIIAVMLKLWGFRFLENMRLKRQNKPEHVNHLMRNGRTVRQYGRPVAR
jgi:hypothetical protein